MCLPAQPVQLNVYPVKSLLHLFLWGELLGTARLFNRDEIFFAFISSGRLKILKISEDLCPEKQFKIKNSQLKIVNSYNLSLLTFQLHFKRLCTSVCVRGISINDTANRKLKLISDSSCSRTGEAY